MNKETAIKILEINKNDDLSYDEKISQMEEIAGSDIESHINIKSGGRYSKRNSYILEAYKFLNNFKSRYWLPFSDDVKVKPNEKPIEFKILTNNDKEIKYSLYNEDQLYEETECPICNINISKGALNYLLELGINEIKKLKNIDLKQIKNEKNPDNSVMLEIIDILNKYSDKKIDEDIIPVDFKNKNLKEYLLLELDYKIKNNYSLACRNNEIFKLRYGLLDNKVRTLEEVASYYDITRERVRQIIAKTLRRIEYHIKKERKSSEDKKENNVSFMLYCHLQKIKEELLQNSTDNYISKQIADTILTREFGSNNPSYLDLINYLCDSNFMLEETKKPSYKSSSNDEIKAAILACIREFSGLYGRSGIARILKGSRGLKENDHNSASINSKYFGMFKQLTLSFITSEIDELIKDEMITSSKINFGMPVLNINPKIADKTDSFSEDLPVKTEEAGENDDENITKVLYLVKQNKNVFITGHAGTGKSYILSKLKERIPDIVITSTTGIAAVNVKGQTLHSWAGVGICNNPVKQTVDKILNNPTIKKQIQKCKILAVDEVSMLDIKTFEYVDAVLKQVRECERAFGGIQVIFIGDFFQLPPVEKNEVLNQKYCFESNLWNDLDLYTVLLTKNYRQNEENLITALSHMRTNSLTSADINLLKTREYKENDDIQNALHIFATNFEADNYNSMKFSKIDSKEYKLYAIDGFYKGEKLVENPTNTREENILKRIDIVCSAEKSLLLKVGARVMLLINQDFEKGLINGSCGEVKEINDDYILVNFDNGQTAKITKHDFEFYNNEKLIAMRRQFPLRLAYGITIHKSQGMSLDKLVVDCSKIFEKGQAYVALSRIKTLNGLYLRNFSPAKVMTDDVVVDFYKKLKIFDEKIEPADKENILKNCKETILTEDKNNEVGSTEDYVDRIKNIILENNRWTDVYEIAETLGVNRHEKLVKYESNSTIAHLINRFLKKQGFQTMRINYDHDYSIIVAPPGFTTQTIPDEMFEKPYKNRK